MKVDLSDPYIRALRAPDIGRIEISDAKRRGLRLRLYAASLLFPKGKAVWMYEKRVKGGKKRKHTLGTWPELSLASARAEALEIEVEAAKGIDRVSVAQENRLEAEAALASLSTVQQVIDTYDRLHLSALRTGMERKRAIEKALSRHLGKSIAKLTRKDIQEAIDAKAMEGYKVYANRIRSMLLALTNWAWQRGYIETPIGAGIPKATSETARERVLSISETQQIWQATYSMGVLWGPFLRLMLLTGQRRAEIAKLRWVQVDFEKRRLIKAGSETKNGKPHITHLSPPAMSEIQMMEPNGSEYIFTTNGKTPISGFSRMKRSFDRLLGNDFEHWRLHDIRTAMATALAESGEPETVVDRILNHSASGSAPSAVARVYNQAQQLPQRAQALDRWAELVTGECSKIVYVGDYSA
ncbi:tyrosine-type recombinase/integrase [Sulfitobacter sp. SK012]|uniref:tyrosine-type recombinase/integrase n=1 Tax=Sulfitobacter sp. SK012 TaxID=1389005 RepID=UPI0020C7CD69|nr:site-specific integrase [Sulfitobacter sp. SK012]